MIWHIFRKDWKLTWPLVAVAAFAHAMLATLFWLWDRQPDALLQHVAQIFFVIAPLASAIVCIALVHNDPIPGDREDWLGRPIRRADLLAEKLLFVLAAVVGPIFLIDAAAPLAEGFSLAASAGDALVRSLEMLVAICLPALLLAALTRNVVEAIMGAVIAGVAGTALIIFFDFVNIHPTLNNSGLEWWGTLVFYAAVVAGAVAILPLQYFRRATAISRWVLIPFFLALSFQQLPWSIAFAGQELLTPRAASGDRVAMALDPSLPRSARTAIQAGVIGRTHASLVNLPIRAEGVPAGDVLLVDRAEIQLIENGKVIYHQNDAEFSYDIPAFANGRTQLRQKGADGQVVHGYQAILLPVAMMNRIRDHAVTLEIDYSLSLFRKDATGNLAALDDSGNLKKIGWCRTGTDDDGDGVALRCTAAGRWPNCMSGVLENPATGQRDPEIFVCDQDYGPILMHFVPVRFGLELKFTEPGEAGKYPVGEPQLDRARVNLTSYQAAAHFTRQVVIPHVRLGDWEAPTSDAAAANPG